MDIKGYRIEAAKDGNPTLIVSFGGRELPLHSRVSPLREGEKYSPECDPDKYDLLIVLGCGLGYHLMGLKDSIDKFNLVVIVDILGGIENITASVSHTAFLAQSENVRIISGEEPDQARQMLEEIIDLDRFSGIKVIEHPPSMRIFSEYYERIKTSISEIIDRAGRNRATVNAFGQLFLRNSINNTANFDSLSPVSALKNRFGDIPAVILSSAPSLEDHVDEIVQYRNRFAVIAVDSALPALREYGIIPDFAVSIDPQHRIGEHFLGHEGDKTAHIFSIVSNPDLVKKTGGFISLNSHPISQIIEKFFPGEVGSIDSGTGSVAGDALAFAMAGGFDPICMAGFDFSFSKNMIYARGSAYQNRYALFMNNRFITPEGFNASYIFKSSKSLVHEGRYTRRSFIGYRDSLGDFIGKEGRRIFFLNPRGLSVKEGIETGLSEFIASTDEETVLPDIKKKIEAVASRRISEIVDRKVLANCINDRAVRDELLQLSLGDHNETGDIKKFTAYLASSGLVSD